MTQISELQTQIDAAWERRTELYQQTTGPDREAVVILDGRRPHAMLVELFTEHGSGTLVRHDAG